MFTSISHSGIVMDNMRDLSISILASSLIIPLLTADAMMLVLGLLIGGYYGWRIEKQIHELRSLGGRILRGRSWDYLILA